ncbi:MAG TPA: hydroxyacid dehydrogenase [Anaerolineales bacterium]|nr:hydroxyacid dehydrogenase [Anaerolineales bacterium]
MENFSVFVSDGLEEAGLELLRKVASVTVDAKISAEDLISVLPEYDALIVRSRTKVTKEVLQSSKRLKVVGRAGVGVDNIDLKAAKAAGITVVNSPLAASNAVAELALGFMLSMARRIPDMDASMKAYKWEKSSFKGSEIEGKVLGLLGLGRIGGRVAELARAFGMTILAYDPFVSAEEIRMRHAEPASFDELLEQSDYISLHLPLTEVTRGLIGANQFDMMKTGVRLICTARGGVVDEAALKDALDSGKVAGAALDVFATEPPASGNIASHPRVIASPHIGAQTKEAQTKAGIGIAQEVIAVLQNKEPHFRVV